MKYLIIITALFLMNTKAFAQLGDPPPMALPVTTETLKAAEEMLLAAHVDKQVIQSAYDAFNSTGSSVPTEKKQAYFKVIKQFVDKYCGWDVLKTHIVKLYAEAYTLNELKELTAFYKTPLGQKLASQQMQLSQQVMAVASASLSAHQTEVAEALK